MKTATSLLWIILLLASDSFAQRTIRVPQDYPTIQAAIDAAVNGDTVLVAEGTYLVNLRITKEVL